MKTNIDDLMIDLIDARRLLRESRAVNEHAWKENDEQKKKVTELGLKLTEQANLAAEYKNSAIKWSKKFDELRDTYDGWDARREKLEQANSNLLHKLEAQQNVIDNLKKPL